MRERWERGGTKLGVGFCLAGFVVIFLGWNGAASVDRITAQLPYVLSGGLAGLGLVVLGAALIVAESRRDDHVHAMELLSEVKAVLERMAPAAEEDVDSGLGPQVVVGHASYHRPDCRLLEGRADELPRASRESAIARGLIACRICDPAPAAPSRPKRSGRAPRTRPRSRR